MAQAVRSAIATGEHVAVQAGTGTGKSLAYLVPAIHHAVEKDSTVVISTATIALQRQLVDRDLPRLAKALKPLLGRTPTFAILKGRRNYLCLNKLHGGDENPEDELFDPFQISAMGRAVKRIHEWADDTETGDRDELVPGVPDSTWRMVSVTARECLGAAKCPVGDECFAERARAEAGRADIVVTNHALLAIDAMDGRAVLPEHDVVVVDEAHELVDRVTGVATGRAERGRGRGGRAQAGQADRPVDRRSAGRGGRRPRPRARGPAARPLGGAPPARVRGAVGGARRGRRLPHGAGRRAPGGARRRGGPQDRAGRAGGGARHHRPAAQGVRRAGSGEALRRRVAGRGGRRSAQGAARRPAVGRRAAARAAVRALHGGAHVGHAGPRRQLRRAGPAVGAPPGRGAHRRPGARSRGPEVVGAGCRLAVRARQERHPLRRQVAAPARPRRAAARLPRRDRRARRGGGRPHARAVLVDARRQAGHRGAARPAGHTAALPGRRRHDAAGQAVRRGRRDVAVRHAVALAGRRRARARRSRA